MAVKIKLTQERGKKKPWNHKFINHNGNELSIGRGYNEKWNAKKTAKGIVRDIVKQYVSQTSFGLDKSALEAVYRKIIVE